MTRKAWIDDINPRFSNLYENTRYCGDGIWIGVCAISNNPVDIKALKNYRCSIKITVIRVVPGDGIHPFSFLTVDGFNPFQRLCIADPTQIYLSG